MKVRSTTKRRKGSAIAEFGPALFIFIIMLFFPLMDLLGMAAIYGCGWYANFMAVRELSVRKSGDVLAVAGPDGEINQKFMPTGMAAFIGIQGKPVHTVTYSGTGTGSTVRCTTAITGKPFIVVPFFVAIPGISSNITFSTTSERPREVTN